MPTYMDNEACAAQKPVSTVPISQVLSNDFDTLSARIYEELARFRQRHSELKEEIDRVSAEIDRLELLHARPLNSLSAPKPPPLGLTNKYR